MSVLSSLPTLAELRAKPQACPKGTTRRDEHDAADKQAEREYAAFLRHIWKLDKGVCRCCGRKVFKKLEHVGDRGEVHHVYGRLKILLTEVRTALLLCGTCHDLVTGAVGQTRLFLVGKSYFKADDDKKYLNVRKAVTFRGK